MIAIRRLGQDDWRAFRDVRLAALAESPGNFSRSLAEEERKPDGHWHYLLTDPNCAIFGLFDDERMIGITCVYAERDDPAQATAGLGMTWIDPAYRGRGLAALYYRERLDWARSRGFARIVVGHRRSNKPSRHAMIAAGFRPIGTAPHDWPDGTSEDEILYQLDLT